METRECSLSVVYNNTNISVEINQDLLDFSYTDSIEDKSNDVSITLADNSYKWRSDWFPKPSSFILPVISVKNWTAGLTESKLDCGKFYIDKPELNESNFRINGISTPYTSSVKSTKNNRSWQKISLKSLANDIASKNKLSLFYDFDDTIYFEKITQVNKTDIDFISGIVKEFGGSTKLENDRIIIFNKSKYAEKSAITSLDTEKWISSYSFSIEDQESKKSSSVKKHDSKSKKLSSKTASKKKGSGTEKKNTNLLLDSASEKKLAEATLKRKTGLVYKASLSVIGNPYLYAGGNIDITGDFAGIWKGKYLIEKVTHKIANDGYNSELELKKF